MSEYAQRRRPLLPSETPQSLLALAQAGYAPSTRPLANAHIHIPPNFSAFETVQQAVQLMEAQGIGVAGTSNYYDFSVYQEFSEHAYTAKVFPLFGLEIITFSEELATAGIKVNDPGNPGKFYVCGKGITLFDPLTPEAEALLAVIRGNDSTRMAAMTEKLAEVFRTAGLDTG